MNEKNDYNPVTKALHCKIDNAIVDPIVTPLYQNSAFSSESPYFYTRKNNPNYEEFEMVIAALEESEYSLSVTTGMTAISIALTLLRPGDLIVLNRDVYGCSYKAIQRLANQLNIKLVTLDLSIPDQIDKIPAEVRMVFFETPTNPFLKTINISSIAKKVKSLNPESLIVVDNTWATPLFQKPLQHGADISLYSATKYFSGHSDVMGGVIVTNNETIANTLIEERFYRGTILEPHSAWLLRRSMQTFELRMREHARVVKIMKEFLTGLPQITKVYYPNVDNHQLKDYGCILFSDLRDDLVDQYKTFSQSLNLFSTGTGMACVTSMIAQPYTGSHASMTDEEKGEIGLGKNHIRFCFGMENVDDLKRDIIQAFNKIDPKG